MASILPCFKQCSKYVLEHGPKLVEYDILHGIAYNPKMYKTPLN